MVLYDLYNMSTNDNDETVKKVPDEFIKIIKDFVSDIKITFPEFEPLINKWWKPKTFFDYIEDEAERDDAHKNADVASMEFIFQFCQKKFPPKFFEICSKFE